MKPVRLTLHLQASKPLIYMLAAEDHENIEDMTKEFVDALRKNSGKFHVTFKEYQSRRWVYLNFNDVVAVELEPANV